MNKTAEQMWEDFLDRLAATRPLGDTKKKDYKPVRHTNFLGSINEYRKIFLEANKSDNADN